LEATSVAEERKPEPEHNLLLVTSINTDSQNKRSLFARSTVSSKTFEKAQARGGRPQWISARATEHPSRNWRKSPATPGL